MRRYKKNFVLLASVAISSGLSLGWAAADTVSTRFDVFSHIDAEHSGVGLGAFMPLYQSHNHIAFLDVSAHLSEDRLNAISAGIGYRISNNWGTLGVNGFLDYGETLHSDFQIQIGAGLEISTDRFFAVGNAYLPVEQHQTAAAVSEIEIIGNQLQMRLGEEHFARRLEMELGAQLLDFSTEMLTGSLWAVAGGEFQHFSMQEERSKAHLGLEMEIAGISQNTSLNLSLAAQYDDADRENKWDLGAGVRFNFGLGYTDRASSHQGKLAIGRVRRGGEIVSRAAASGALEGVVDHLTDVNLATVVFAADNAQLAQALMPTNQLTVVTDGGAAYSAFSIGGDRTVMGGSSEILLRGQQSGVVVTYRAPGARPTVNMPVNSSPSTGISLTGNGAHVAGFDIAGYKNTNLFLGTVGVGANAGASNIAIEQMAISNINSGIVILPFGRDIQILSNHIDDVNIGVEIGSNLENVLIADNRIGNATILGAALSGHGIGINTHAAPATSQVEPVTVRNNVFYGTLDASAIRVQGAGYAVAGSGNIFSATSGMLCINANTSGTISGMIEFDTGTVLNTGTVNCFQ